MAEFAETWDFSEWSVGRDGSASIKAVVLFDPATETEYDVELAAINGLPAVYAGYVFNSAKLKPIAWNTFQVTAMYKPLGAPDTTGATPPEFSFEVATESIKVLAALATVSQGAVSGRTAPNHGGLIGVTDEGVEGIEVPQAVFSFSEVHHFEAAAITGAYKIQLAKLVGKVNSTSFRGFAAGELLCTGVSGSIRGTDLWTLRYGWSALPNVSGLSIGPLSGITKRGWDYLEIHFEEEVDATNKVTLKKPYAYTVHQVIGYENYGLFGIGT